MAKTLVALLAASLAVLLLADVALGQTFTYSRGWKPGGKRARAAQPPPPPPRSRVAPKATAGYPPAPEDVVLDDQPVRYYVEALGERWAPFDVSPWRPQAQPPVQDDEERERYRHVEQPAQVEHDDH